MKIGLVSQTKKKNSKDFFAELRDAIFFFQSQIHETFANHLTVIYI